MLEWAKNLTTRGYLAYLGCVALVTNGILFFFGLWMPIVFGISVGLLLIAWCIPSDDSTQI